MGEALDGLQHDVERLLAVLDLVWNLKLHCRFCYYLTAGVLSRPSSLCEVKGIIPDLFVVYREQLLLLPLLSPELVPSFMG